MPGGVHPPLSVIEEWAKITNPEHPSQQRGWALVVVVIVAYTAAVLTVCARLWARLVLLRNYGLDDLLIVAALLPATALAISTCLASRIYGFDRHSWDLTPQLAVHSRKVTLAIEFNYVVSTCITKISILLFYRRLTSNAVSTFFKRVIQGSILFVFVYMIALCLALILACKPVSAFWNSVDVTWLLKHPEGRDWSCYNEGAADLTAAIISITQDFLACGLPSALFWKLQMPRRQKIALGAIFGLGFLLCITGILRAYYIYKIFWTTYDVTWEAEGGFLWTSLEAMLGIICASLPALKVFFKNILQSSSFGSSLRYTFRRKGYARSGYAEANDTNPLGTQVSATVVTHDPDKSSSKTSKDIEMGGIEVTKEVNVNTEESPPGSFYDDRPSFDRAKKPGQPQIRRMSSSEAPWLETGPPQDDHANGPIGRSIRNGWR